MSQPPTFSSWKITCHSSEEAQALQQWLSSRIQLDRVLTDTVRVIPNGVEQVQNVPHRLGDYFASIRMLPDSQESHVVPACFPQAAGGSAVLEGLDENTHCLAPRFTPPQPG